jgi:hypothetical protein
MVVDVRDPYRTPRLFGQRVLDPCVPRREKRYPVSPVPEREYVTRQVDGIDKSAISGSLASQDREKAALSVSAVELPRDDLRYCATARVSLDHPDVAPSNCAQYDQRFVSVPTVHPLVVSDGAPGHEVE